jgi:hypothetical protein
VSQDPSLWTHLDLSQGRLKEKYRNDKKLEWFLRKYPNVMEVKIGGWKNTASTTTLKLIAQLCPNLVSIFSDSFIENLEQNTYIFQAES